MPLRAHRRLVVEDAAEVFAVGEDLVLAREKGAARVDEVEAGQVVLQRHLLGAQVLLHRHRVVGAALDGRVVGDDDALATADPPDAGDDARTGRLVVVHRVRRQRRQFQERAAAVEQGVDALTRQELAARHVAVARRLGAAGRRRQPVAQLVHRSPLDRLVPLEGVAVAVDKAAQLLHEITLSTISVNRDLTEIR